MHHAIAVGCGMALQSHGEPLTSPPPKDTPGRNRILSRILSRNANGLHAAHGHTTTPGSLRGEYRADGPVHTLSRAAPPVGRRQAPLWRTGAASTGHAHCEHGPSHDRHRPRVCRTQATSCLTFAEIASPCHGASCRCVCRPHTRRWRTISVPDIARSVLRYRGYEHRRCMPS